VEELSALHGELVAATPMAVVAFGMKDRDDKDSIRFFTKYQAHRKSTQEAELVTWPCSRETLWVSGNPLRGLIDFLAKPERGS
jgi:hypothetical protein